MPAECTVPQSVFVPDYMFDSNDDLNLDVNLQKMMILIPLSLTTKLD